ncbi:MAG: hypothetical protein AAGG09_07150 [Pseudomonadota bacterium]
MIETSSTRRYRDAYKAAHRARAEAFSDLTRRLFRPGSAPSAD